MNGTPRAIGPIAEEVLVWVSHQKTRLAKYERIFVESDYIDNEEASAVLQPRRDTLRRIELCALAAREAAMFHDLYGLRQPSGHIDHIGGDPHADAPEV